MEAVLLVVHLMLAIGLVAIILLQKSEGGALGMGGGGGGGMAGFLTGRAAGNILTRVTAVLAALFMCTSLALAIISSRTTKAPSSVTDRPSPTAPANNTMPSINQTLPTQPAPTQPAPTQPTEPAKPAVPTK
ncbi:MAG: preprotein translocase subunit SecG [Alphaproteobacteria bacterium]